MSELARKRYERANGCKEAKPLDMLSLVQHELEQPENPDTYVMVIRAHKDEDGMHYVLNHAGDFNIAERIGLLTLLLHRLAE